MSQETHAERICIGLWDINPRPKGKPLFRFLEDSEKTAALNATVFFLHTLSGILSSHFLNILSPGHFRSGHQDRASDLTSGEVCVATVATVYERLIWNFRISSDYQYLQNRHPGFLDYEDLMTKLFLPPHFNVKISCAHQTRSVNPERFFIRALLIIQVQNVTGDIHSWL